MLVKEQIHYGNQHAANEIGNYLLNAAENIRQGRGIDKFNEFIVICIGAHDVVGDALGPLVGTRLSRRKINASIYGTMHDPFHALNLLQVLEHLNVSPDNRNRILTIAVDACLGYVENIGQVQVRNIGIKPGLGVGKNFPPIGDISIAGIVNFHELTGSNDLVIQNTDKHLVLSMSRVISKGIVTMLEQVGRNTDAKIC